MPDPVQLWEYETGLLSERIGATMAVDGDEDPCHDNKMS